MATLGISYASTQDIIISAVSGLAVSAFAQSAVFVNATTTAGYVDGLIGGYLRTGSTEPNDTVDVFCFARVDEELVSAFGGAVDGGIGLVTSAIVESSAFKFENVALAGVINCETSVAGHWFGPWSVAQLFGGTMPPEFGFIMYNNTSDAIGALPIMKIKGVKYVSS